MSSNAGGKKNGGDGGAGTSISTAATSGGKGQPKKDEEDVSELLFGAFTTYLRPLLDKHASDRPTLAFEDLLLSWHAVEKFLQPHSTNKDNEEEYRAVLKRVSELHKGQVLAYRDAAITGLREFAATTFELPSVEEFLKNAKKSAGAGGGTSDDPSSTRESYVQHACELALEQRPNWKVGTGILAKIVSATVKQRAGDAFDAHQKELAASKAAAVEAPSSSTSTGANNDQPKKSVIEFIDSDEDSDEDGEIHDEDDDKYILDSTSEEEEDESHGGWEDAATELLAAKARASATPAGAVAKKQGGTKRKAPPPGSKNPKASVMRKKVGGKPASQQPRAPTGPAGRGSARRGRGGGAAGTGAGAATK